MAEPMKKTGGTQSSTGGAATGRGKTPGTQTQGNQPMGGTMDSRSTSPLSGTMADRSSAPLGNTGDAQNVMQQVRSTATDALNTAKTNTAAKIEEKKSTFSSGLTNVADNVRKLGDGLSTGDQHDPISRFAADYSGMAADKLDTVADYFNSHDLDSIYRDTESFARRNPAVVIGGALALGFLAARFFKSSGSMAGGGGSSSGMSRSNMRTPAVRMPQTTPQTASQPTTQPTRQTSM